MRRLEILSAAARVFRRLGIAAAGMREIAEEADLSPGNLYYYFRGKDELLYFCQDRTLEQMQAAVESAQASGAGAAEQVHAVLRAHLHCTLDEMQGATAHLEVDALPASLRGRIMQKRDHYERSIRALVSRGVKRGEFAACDAAMVTRAMLGAVNWTARWYSPEGPQTVTQIADALADYLVRGLMKNAPKVRPESAPKVRPESVPKVRPESVPKVRPAQAPQARSRAKAPVRSRARAST